MGDWYARLIPKDFFGPFTRQSAILCQVSPFGTWSEKRTALTELISSVISDTEAFKDQENFKRVEEISRYAFDIISDFDKDAVVSMIPINNVHRVLCNLADALNKQLKFEEARDFAAKALDYVPNSYVAIFILSNSFKGEGQLEKATATLLQIIEHPVSLDIYILVIVEVAEMITHMQNQNEWNEKTEGIIPLHAEDKNVWATIVCILLDKKEYEAVGILTVGECGKDRVPQTFLHNVVKIPGLKLDKCDVGRILGDLRKSPEGLKPWHLKMCEFLISCGGNVRTITEHFSMPLISAVTIAALEGEKPSFLDTFLEQMCPSEYDTVMENGDCALHVLTKHPKCRGQKAALCAKKLLSKGCVPLIKNKEGKLPQDYLPTKHDVFMVLKQYSNQPELCICPRVEALNKKGNEAIAHKEYESALGLCKTTLTVLSFYPHLTMEAAKALLIKGQSLLKLGRRKEAFGAFLAGAGRCSPNDEQVKPFLEHILALLPGAYQADFSSEQLGILICVLTQFWSHSLKFMTENKLWASLSIIVMGHQDIGPLFLDFDAKEAVLHTIFLCLNDKSFDAPALVDLMLQKGADLKNLCSEPGKERAIHAVVRFCVLTGDIRVFKRALKILSKEEIRGAVNQEGHTPLHTLALETQGRKITMVFQDILKQLVVTLGLDVKAKDNIGKIAEDYMHAKLKTVFKDITQTKCTNPKQVNPDYKISWEELKAQGSEYFKKGDWRSAARLYTEAITSLEREIGLKDASRAHILNDTESHGLAVLYGNRAECWCKLKETRQFLQDAQRNVDYDAKWFKGHYRMCRALSALNKFQPALSSFLRACNNWRPEDGPAFDIITSLINLMLTGTVDRSIYLKRHSTQIGSDIWARVALHYLEEVKQTLQGPDFDILLIRAEFACLQIQGPASTKLVVDLSKLTFTCAVWGLRWIPSLILFLVESGTSIRSFCDSKMPYLHSVITMVMMSSCSPVRENQTEDSDALKLVKLVLQKEVRPSGEWNLRGSNNETVLHLMNCNQFEFGCNAEMQVQIAQLFLEGGTNPLLKDRDGYIALDYSNPNGKLYGILKSFSQKGRSRGQRSVSREQRSTSRGQRSVSREQEFVAAGVQRVKGEACDECVEYLEAAAKWARKGNLKEAYKNLVAVLHRTNSHQKDQRHSTLKAEAMEKIIELLRRELNPSIPKDLLRINPQTRQELLESLAGRNLWKQMESLVSKLKLSKQEELSGFAQNMSINNLATTPNLCGAEDFRLQTLTLLLDHGATFDPSTATEALTKVMKNEEFKVALKFLELGADPKGLSFKSGDTPNHAALVVAVEKEKGNFKLFTKLRDLYQSDPKKYSYLKLDCQDIEGNSLLHLVAQVKFSRHSLQAVEMLRECQVPVDVPNYAGKLPQDLISNPKDRRLPFLQIKAMQTKEINEKTEKIEKVPAPKVEAVAAEPVSWEQTGAKPKTVIRKAAAPSKSAEFYRKEAESLLETLEKTHSNRNEREEENSSDAEEEDDEEEEEEEKEEEGGDQLNEYSEESETNYSDEDEAEGWTGIDNAEKEDDKTEIDEVAFENYPWEVECTEEVWALLRSQSGESMEGRKKRKKEQIPKQLKEVIVKKIKSLASGHWNDRLARRVKRPDIPSAMLLYQVALPKGACIYWELTLAFSERETHREAERLRMASIKIYSEVIRVWSIVLKPADKKDILKKIATSFCRGQDCILKKELTVLRENKTLQQEARSPTLYVQTKDQPKKLTSKDSEKSQQQRVLYPPASHKKNNFHILKFYSFSSSLVSAILSQSDLKIDFPFRVTETEHEYINLETDAPFLLLGRSGTGKTTCCLYRIWNHCIRYWHEVEKAGGKPLIPIDFLDEKEANKDDEADDARQNADAEQNADADQIADAEQSDDANESDEESEDFCHLRQIFVTKNPILCEQVEKNFRKLRQACKVMRLHNEVPRQPLTNTLEEVESLSYPLFLTSRLLLILLDASVDTHESVDDGKPFFPRDEYSALRYPLPGWGSRDDPNNIFPADQTWLLDSSDEEDNEVDQMKKQNMDQPIRRNRLRDDPRRECTYEVFAHEVWPKIAKKLRNEVHPSLVWTEIMSFIKGSYEALNCDKGYLSRELYMELGRKRAPTFSGDRDKVYDVFLNYATYKREHRLFDEPDVVFKIYARLQKMEKPLWLPHEIYVDETQDFTQAELALLVSLASSPNKMFLTGDTAQGIMRGISFRFEDLKSLFFFAQDSDHANPNQQTKVVVPKVHPLTYNYRSHRGILSLASAVLDILRQLFPESFDLMERDQGMFDGPKPVLIDTCNEEDLAMLLTGNHRDKSNIEFGAHQAILVVNEEAREALPKELKAFIVLTIFESKGLEFDDILLYNFFTSSQADTEWRVVTEVLKQILATDWAKEDFPYLDPDWFETERRSRPLQFDPNKHKVLTSELKQLYTALTRARVNIWIFDQNLSRRAPMFEYFQALGLVRSIGASSQETILEAFSEKSTAREWREKGDMFMSKKLYKPAAKCYRNAGKEHNAKLADAYQGAIEARDLPKREQQEAYLKVGMQFLACGDLQRAHKCFGAAKEYLLAAKTAEKNGQMSEASHMYLQSGEPILASRCQEEIGNFRKAIKILTADKLYDQAVDCVHRFELCEQDVRADYAPTSKQSHKELCLQSAREYWNRNDVEGAKNAIMRSRDAKTKIEFFKNRSMLKEAAEVHRENGESEEALEMFLKCGELKEALEVAEQNLFKKEKAWIHLIWARKYQWQEESDVSKAYEHAALAHSAYTELVPRDKSIKPLLNLAKLILGKLIADETKKEDGIANIKMLKQALNSYKEESIQLGGQIECCRALFKVEDLETLQNCRERLEAIALGFEMIHLLQNPDENEVCYRAVLKFYQLEEQVNSDTSQLKVYPRLWPMCWQYIQDLKFDKKTPNVTLARDEVVFQLVNCILKDIVSWRKTIQDWFHSNAKLYLPCPKFLKGLLCSEKKECSLLHRTYENVKEDHAALNFISAMLVLDYHVQTGLEKLQNRDKFEGEVQELQNYGSDTQWTSCQHMMTYILPPTLPVCRYGQDSMQKFVNHLRRLKTAMEQMKRFLEYKWEKPGRVGRGVSEDVIKERCKSTDWFVSASFLSALLHLNIDVRKKVKDLEQSLITSKPHWIEKIRKYALWGGYMPIGKRFLESFEGLTRSGAMFALGPMESFVAFTKVASVFCSRSNLGIMPQLPMLVNMMESYFILSMLLIAKGGRDKCSFYVTSSQWAHFLLLNTCIKPEKKAKADASIQSQVAELVFPSSFQFIITRQYSLCNLLVGHSRFGHLGLLGLASLCFEGDRRVFGKKGPDHTLARRILALALTVWLNIPNKFVDSSFESPFRREFYNLQYCPELPADVRQLLKVVNQATSYFTVIEAAQVYLSSDVFKDELAMCQWTRSVSCPVLKQPFMLIYKDLPFFQDDISQLAQETISIDILQNEDRTEEEEEMDDEDAQAIKERKEKMEREERKRRLQTYKIKIIIRALRVQVFKRRLLDGSYRFYELDLMFKPYAFNEKRCNICGVDLVSQKEKDSFEDDTETGPESSSSHAERHAESPSHVERQRMFEDFKHEYIRKVNKKYEEVCRFLAKHKITKDSTAFEMIEGTVSDILTANEKFLSKRQELLNNFAWSDFPSLLEQFEALWSVYQAKRPLVLERLEEIETEARQQQEEARLQTAHMERMEDGIIEDDSYGISDPTDVLLDTGNQGHIRKDQMAGCKGHQENGAQKGSKKRSHQQRKREKKKEGNARKN